MPRLFLPLLAFLFAWAGPLRGADASLAAYGIVAVKPAVAAIYIATINMTIAPFVRHNVVYASTYYAKVFPYFFYNERGRIWIVVTDDDLRRVAQGKAVDFKGHAINEDGEDRRVEGRAVPTGALTGNLRVKVFVTRRIALTYETTYELRGKPSALSAAIPR